MILTAAQQSGRTAWPENRETPSERISGAGTGIKEKEDEAAERRPAAPASKQDEYISAEQQESTKPKGIYSLTKDRNGNPRIAYDDPKGTRRAVPDTSADPAGTKKPTAEKCTANTDRVDSEIKMLKQEQQKIRQQLNQEVEDSDKRAVLEQRLASVESELKTKDNDSYRKQHTAFTSEGAN